jgi:transmembrane sensor
MLAASYRTAPGERSRVTLDDGSLVQLGTDSALALAFDARQRRVVLLAGEAYFAVAPMTGSETRPFVVEAAGGTATALGTQFMVDRRGDGMTVTVAEHTVRVAAAQAGNATRAVVLSPGETVRYDRVAGLGMVAKANIDRATAWRRGRLVFDEVPLSEVVAELNRYRRGPIVLADGDFRDRRVSGVFDTADLDAALRAITREMGLKTATLPPFVTILY